MTEGNPSRNKRKVIGVVTSDKMNKTRRVEIQRLVKHPRYGKYVRQRTVCHVHDETNDSHLGDRVEIIESRPLSKLKHWELVRIVSRAPLTRTAKQATEAEATDTEVTE